jgi:hypothetical protein
VPALLIPTIRSARRSAYSSPAPISGRYQQRRFKSKTVEEARSRYRTGPFSWKAGVLFVLAGAGLVWYFESEKKRMQRKRIAEATKGVGKPKVGGDFNLVDHNGKPFSSADMKGRYALVSPPASLANYLSSFLALHIFHRITTARERKQGCAIVKKYRLTDVFMATGLLRLHTLSRYLPGRTRQDGENV